MREKTNKSRKSSSQPPRRNDNRNSDKYEFICKNDEQKEALQTISENKITLLYGAPGTGKTFIAISYALQQVLRYRQQSKIVLIRPAVEAFGENLGFLPGSYEEKVAPYMVPMIDIFKEYITQDFMNTLIRDDVVQTVPLAFLRGRTFNDSIVIADEMENAVPSQIRLLLTRIGRNSKIILTGDPNQADRNRGEDGLQDAIHRLNGIQGIGKVFFSDACVVRDRIIIDIEKAYSK